ncbi:DNA/RNA helicase DEAD/DEAH box type N-terminal [Penicillium lagena]|uniref:DNA/RNA helicase DEAD/DEAH box type N-terminal n=1 Tax=Penicillium lagena TaxID=94218 RepID=UPI00254067EB|nr:DNA/RNA helicase DEAD/DEAH box type N-terminal [Penicillium lagena]KAJ5624586.1 DNA/RNA helicase DEAD/DEAH box type N-terminal [Penicillium lagena]
MPDEGAPRGLSQKIDKKRKRQADESAVSKQDKSDAAPPPADAPNKKKKKAKKNKKEQSEQDVNRKDGVDESIGKMDGRLLADHFAQKAKKLDKELSAVELSDLSVPDSAFLDASSFSSSRSLDQLPTFLKSFSPKGVDLSKSAKEPGTPHTLVVTAAGLRAADMVRALRSFQNKESIVGKLFAKHIKLEEAKQFLQRAQMGIGVGTPTRVSDLIESGTLKVNELQRIVIDGSYIDQKQRGIFDMKDTHLPLLRLLTRSELRERYGKTKLQIVVF